MNGEVVPITLTTDCLTHRIKPWCSKERVILDNVNTCIDPTGPSGEKQGHFMTVIGPSGSGKTTYINCISHRQITGHRTGSIQYNGREEKDDVVRKVVRMVPQRDRLSQFLSVRETLWMYAKLKLPKMTPEERQEEVDRVVDQLRLGYCLDVPVGGPEKKGLSNGELKRLAIAVELLTTASLLVLDEPTTGLDSVVALDVINHLKDIAHTGRGVVCTVHQPSSQIYEAMEYLMVLQEGRVAYYGLAADLPSYLESIGFPCPSEYNPCDFVIDLVAARKLGSMVESDPEIAAMMAQAVETDFPGVYLKSPEHTKQEARRNDAHDGQAHLSSLVSDSGPWIGNTAVLFWRYFTSHWRNKLTCFGVLLIFLLQGLILGGIFWQLTAPALEVDASITADIPESTMESQWIQTLLEGLNGNGIYPLVETVESGIYPVHPKRLPIDWFDARTWRALEGMIGCLHNTHDLSSSYPPSEFVWEHEEIHMGEGFGSPQESVSAVVKALQVMDFYSKKNYDNFMRCRQRGNLIQFSRCMTSAPQFIPQISLVVGCVTGGGDSTTVATNLEMVFSDFIKLTEPDIEEDPKPHIERRMLSHVNDMWTEFQACDSEGCQLIRTLSGAGGLNLNASLTPILKSLSSTMNVFGALFFFVGCVLYSTYHVVTVLPDERPIVNKETANGLYTMDSYVTARFLSDIPFHILPVLLFAGTFLPMSGMDAPQGSGIDRFQYLVVALTFILVIAFAAYGFCYWMSTVLPSGEAAAVGASAVVTIWAVIAGFFVRDAQIPGWIGWSRYLGSMWYGYHAMGQLTFPKDQFLGALPGTAVRAIGGLVDTAPWLLIVITLVIGIAYRVLSFVCLVFFYRAPGVET